MAAVWPAVLRRPRLENIDEVYNAIDIRITLVSTTWNIASGAADPGPPVAGRFQDLVQFRNAVEFLATKFYNPAQDPGGFVKYTFASIATAAFGSNDWRNPDPVRRPHANDLNDLRSILLLMLYLEVQTQGWDIPSVGRRVRGQFLSSAGTTHEEAWDDIQANQSPGYAATWSPFGFPGLHHATGPIVTIDFQIHDLSLFEPAGTTLSEITHYFAAISTQDENAHEDPNMKIEGKDTQPAIVAGNWGTMTEIGATGGLAVADSPHADIYITLSDINQFIRYYTNGWRDADDPLGEVANADAAHGASEPFLLGKYTITPF